MAVEVPVGSVDERFSNPAAVSAVWTDVVEVLRSSELYWISTVRADGRPHVTPLIGVWHDDEMCIATGFREQKAHNLSVHEHVALTTGVSTWAAGLDVVLEGPARRITQRAELEAVAAAYVTKYGHDWEFEVSDDCFGSGEHAAGVFAIRPVKVLAFAKSPHAQTTFRM